MVCFPLRRTPFLRPSARHAQFHPFFLNLFFFLPGERAIMSLSPRARTSLSRRHYAFRGGDRESHIGHYSFRYTYDSFASDTDVVRAHSRGTHTEQRLNGVENTYSRKNKMFLNLQFCRHSSLKLRRSLFRYTPYVVLRVPSPHSCCRRRRITPTSAESSSPDRDSPRLVHE